MSIIKSEDEKKWLNAFVAIMSALAAFICIRFFYQLGEWFDLESKIKYFFAISQGVGIVIGVTTFATILKHKKAYKYLKEVYGELVKVIWPDRDSVVKLTIGLMIALAIISGILVLVDYIFRTLLSLIY